MAINDFLISDHQLEIAKYISARILICIIGHSLSYWVTLSRELPKLISSFVARYNFVIYLALPLWRVIPWLPAAKLEMRCTTDYFIYLSKINRKRLFELALFASFVFHVVISILKLTDRNYVIHFDWKRNNSLDFFLFAFLFPFPHSKFAIRNSWSAFMLTLLS